jgi:hypothetical protein
MFPKSIMLKQVSRFIVALASQVSLLQALYPAV